MAKKKRRKRSRGSSYAPIFWIAGIVVALAGTAGAAYYLVKYFSKTGKKNEVEMVDSGNPNDPPKVSAELKSLLEEMDKKSPGWRLPDIAAKRRKLDAAKNGAMVIDKAHKLAPEAQWNSANYSLERCNPAQPITDADFNQCRGLVQQFKTPLNEALKVVSYPNGVYPVQFNFKCPLQTLLPYAQPSRQIVQLLGWNALVQSHDKDGPGAAQSCLGMMCIITYYRDDPTLITQLVRIAMTAKAVASLERAMTCANFPDASLVDLQQLFESEGDGTPLLTGLRGDRAVWHGMIANVAKGEAAWADFPETAGASVSDADHIWVLKQINAAIDLASKHVPQQSNEWTTLAAEIKNGPASARQVLPAIDRLLDPFARITATNRATAIALAAERYRRDKGDWPAALKQLVPSYMKSLPVDPYTGKEFKYAKNAEGIAIYVQGSAPSDQRGAFTSIGSKEQENQGFRLLDPKKRR